MRLNDNEIASQQIGTYQQTVFQWPVLSLLCYVYFVLVAYDIT